MIRVSNIRSSVSVNENQLVLLAGKKLNIRTEEIISLRIVRRSLDARKKSDIHYVYTVDIKVSDESAVIKKNSRNRNISQVSENKYILPEMGKGAMPQRPVIAGSGPAGLFCAYMLAINGYKPILIEQGEDADRRAQTVEAFWEGRKPLNPFSNVQYGEGGAGTFSDGKLNSSVHDKDGRNGLVLKIFADNGADKEILYDAKPHIGTEKLRCIVKNMRNEIIKNGGEVRFNTRLAGLNIINGALENITLEDIKRSEENGGSSPDSFYHLQCSTLVAAIGHSSRDTFNMFRNSGLDMEAKAFAVGVRAEHKQKTVNEAQYGTGYEKKYPDLPPADYKLVYHARDGHSVYSFCMCPGGYVVDSSSEEGRLCINGMSYSGRDSSNANSAIIVSVTPEDTGADKDLMAGFDFQKELEERAWIAAGGRIPVQSLEGFNEKLKNNNYAQNDFAHISACHKGRDGEADLTSILPDFICRDIAEAFDVFGKTLMGFDRPDTLLSAVESRTSSPVRIIRDKAFESNIRGIFPAGEGAGYAGGIMSAAIDGIKVFEELFRRYSA